MARSSVSANAEDLGKLLLRVVIGVLMLLHGFAKIKGGIDPIIGMATQHGLPVFVAFGVYVGEVIAPILLIIGLYTRAAALLVAINMAFAVALAHGNQLLSLTKQGGWALELQGLFFFGALAVMLLGAGRYSLGGAEGRAN
ncbi:MAG TPA: DoxX family protein [Burkholderiaceae bacterium]|nr:DoxX family protein [Burkholderiaceae bacterium]